MLDVALVGHGPERGDATPPRLCDDGGLGVRTTADAICASSSACADSWITRPDAAASAHIARLSLTMALNCEPSPVRRSSGVVRREPLVRDGQAVAEGAQFAGQTLKRVTRSPYRCSRARRTTRRGRRSTSQGSSSRNQADRRCARMRRAAAVGSAAIPMTSMSGSSFRIPLGVWRTEAESSTMSALTRLRFMRLTFRLGSHKPGRPSTRPDARPLRRCQPSIRNGRE